MTWTAPNFRNASTPFLNANTLLQKDPIYFCVFGLVTGPNGTGSQVLPTQFCTAPVQNQTISRYRYMSPPRAFSTQFNAITYEASIGQVQFDLQNVNGLISNMIASYTMKNRLVTIYLGYDGIDESAYQPIYSGQIYNFTKSQDATYYTFTVTDPTKMLLANNILQGHTQLSQNLAPTDTNAFVSSINNLSPATDLYDGKGPRSFLKIGHGLYSYTGLGFIKDNTVLWKYLSPFTVGQSAVTAWAASTAYIVGQQVNNAGNIYTCVQAGTSAGSVGPTGQNTNMVSGIQLVVLNANGDQTAQKHQAGESVDNYVRYTGNPIDLMLQVILSTGSGTNGTYDVLPASQGVGIPQSLVNVTNFENLRGQYVSQMTFDGFFSDATSALKFIQQEILRQVHAFLFTNRSGQLDMAIAYAPVGTIDAVTLDDTNLAAIPQFDANLMTGRNFYNDIQVNYDYQPIPDYFATTAENFDANSINTYQEISTLSVDSKALTSFYNALGISSRCINIYLKRFRKPPPVITCKAFFAFCLSNVGDLIYINSAYVPNYITGQDGGAPILCQVINASPDFFGGYMNLTLLGIGFYQYNRYARVTPQSNHNGGSFPDYTSATTAQQLVYGFAGNLVGNAAQMSNGDNGYYISP